VEDEQPDQPSWTQSYRHLLHQRAGIVEVSGQTTSLAQAHCVRVRERGHVMTAATSPTTRCATG
jgi:hypothetical protein